MTEKTGYGAVEAAAKDAESRVAARPAPTARPPAAGPARWEYKAVLLRDYLSKGMFGGRTLERALNELGAEGWELVNLVNDRGIFKRPA